MSRIIKESEGKFENAPVGQYTGIIYQVIDQGTQTSPFYKDQNGNPKKERQTALQLELHNASSEKEFLTSKGKPFVIRIYVKHSIHEKASLPKIGKAAFGFVKYNKLVEEQGGVGLEDLLGKSFICNVIKNKKGSVKVDINTLAELQAGVVLPTQINTDNLFFSLYPEEFKPSVYESLANNTKEKIAGSPEYKQLTGETQKGEF